MIRSPLPPTRERIRHVAEELYVLNGHDGFSFGDVAAAVGTTRANIHHHFGNKQRLMAVCRAVTNQANGASALR